MAIPLTPLQGDASYTATVPGTVTDPLSDSFTNVPVSHTWTFRTRAAPACRFPSLRGRTLGSAGAVSPGRTAVWVAWTGAPGVGEPGA